MYRTQAFYEHIDEEKNQPTCWLSINNACIPHYHSGIELVYIESGEMTATLNGKLHILKSGDLLVVPSYTVHLFDTEKNSHTYVLRMPIDYISSVHSILRKKTFSENFVSNKVALEEISRSMKIISSINTNNNDSLLLRGHSYIILSHLLDTVLLKDISVQANQSQLKNIIGYIHNNYKSAISLETISTIFGYSKSRFSHIFNESVGCSLTEYINSLRCRHAANLLLEDTKSITVSAMDSGFESMRTFYRSFKKYFNMTPTEYIIDVKGKKQKIIPTI